MIRLNSSALNGWTHLTDGQSITPLAAGEFCLKLKKMMQLKNTQIYLEFFKNR